MKKLFGSVVLIIFLSSFFVPIKSCEAAGAAAKRNQKREVRVRRQAQNVQVQRQVQIKQQRNVNAQLSVSQPQRKRHSQVKSSVESKPESTPPVKEAPVTPQASPGKVLTSGGVNESEGPAVPRTLSMNEYNYLIHVGKNIENKTITRRIYSIVEALKARPKLSRADYQFLRDLAVSINNPQVKNGLLTIANSHKP